LGIFDKMNDVLGKFSNRVIAGKAAGEAQPPVYGAEKQNVNYPPVEEAPQAMPEKSAIDPFKRDGEGEYGGRQVYRSKYDQEEVQQRAAAQRMQQTGQFAPVQPTGRFAPVQQNPQMPPQQMQQAAQPAQQGFQPSAAASNVVPFPGMQQGADGAVYGHVEYILFLHGCNQCRKIIDFIKTNASVFLNMEFIASEGERQRCVDFLSGAVYALGCTLSKISPRGIYLISAPTVRVILDSYAQRLGKAPEARGFVQQRYEQGEGRQNAEARPQQYQQQAQRPQMQQRPHMQQNYPQQAQPQAQQPVQQTQPPLQERQAVYQAVSPTQRFAAMGTQRNRPVTFASAMGGSNAGYGERKFPQ